MTLEDFYAEVLKKLGVLAAEEAPTASDRQEVVEKYQAVHAEYSRREIVPWFDDEDVPDWISDSFATLVAFRLTDKFSVSPQKKAELGVDADAALTTLIADGQRREVKDTKANYF